MNETIASINSEQFKNIENAVAGHFQFPIFITNMERYIGEDAEEIVFVDVSVAGHPEIHGTVEVDINLNVRES